MAFLSHVHTVIRSRIGPTSWRTRFIGAQAGDRRCPRPSTVRPHRAARPRPKSNARARNWTGSSRPPAQQRAAHHPDGGRETGMRRSEVVGIQREHLDLMHGVVHLPHTKNGRARRAADPARARGATPLGHRRDARSHLRDAPARSRAPSSARDAAPACAMKPCAVTTDGVPTRPISATCAFMTCGTKAPHSWPRCSRSTSWPRSTATSTPACCCATTIRMGASWRRSWRAVRWASASWKAAPRTTRRAGRSSARRLARRSSARRRATEETALPDYRQTPAPRR